MLAGNSLKMCVGAGFDISSTLVSTITATTDGSVPKSQSSSRTTNENDYKQFR